ncbi:MAG: Jag N-terminal domain-containing protein [Clostridia bacterium]|nr:Jag N-terminal domain-containing protein [Clostridia bacterium]
MIKEAIGIGKTVDEAYENAKVQLNAPFEADVQFTVVEQPKKKAFGIFGKETPAKVKAFYEVPDEQPAPAAKEKKASKPAPAPKAAPVVKEKKPVANPEAFDGTKAYISSILKGLGIESCEITFSEEDDGLAIELDCGENYGVVIGRRGETLDAIQYLVRLYMNKGKDNYKRVSINIGNYREKRAETLRELAKRNAAKVLRNGRNAVLDPMNPYERRIIHTTVQEIEGVESHSVGSDSERKVVITLAEGVKPTNPDSRRYNNRGGKGGYNRGGSRGGNRNSSAQSAPQQPARSPRSDISNASRYGKIEPKKPVAPTEE